MIAALLICEAGLPCYLCWNLQPYARPAFCTLILVMACCAGAYRVTEPVSEFQASATVQIVALGVALLEGIWQASGRDLRTWFGLMGFCVGFAVLVLISAWGLDWRFGGFMTIFTLWLIALFGIVLGGAVVTWDRHLQWLSILCSIKPTGAILYWFIHNPVHNLESEWVPWRIVNDGVMLAMATAMLAWIVWVPIRSEPRT